MVQAADAKLMVHRTTHGDIIYLRLVGTIDEDFNGKAVGTSVEGCLVLSLSEIQRITSFGIRQWVEFVNTAAERCGQIYYVDCAPRVVDQFNMVAAFAGKGVIVSFLAPFRCDQCGTERNRLIQVDRHQDALSRSQLPDDVCPKDGAPEVFDDDPESYLAYIGTQPPLALPPRVSAFLAKRSGYEIPDAMRRCRVEKKVAGRRTCISVSGDLSEEFKPHKVAEGLEGDVVIDLAAVGQVNAAGLQGWRRFVEVARQSVSRLGVLGLPPTILEHLDPSQDLPLPNGEVISLFLPYSCDSCRLTTQAELDVARNQDTLHLAAAPARSCSDCGQPLRSVATPAMLNGLVNLPTPSGNYPCDEVLKWSRERPGPVKDIPSAIDGVTATIVQRPRSGMNLLVLLIALFSLLTAGAAVLVVMSAGNPSAKSSGEPGHVRSSSAAQPPAWQKDQPRLVGGKVVVVGVSGLAADKEEGQRQAHLAALEQLCHFVALRIPGASWRSGVLAQYQGFRGEQLAAWERLAEGEADPAEALRVQRLVTRAISRVTQSLKQGVGNTVDLSRSDSYWQEIETRTGARFKVWGRYTLPAAQLTQLVSQYGSEETVFGTTVVPFFPGLAWRYEQTLGAAVVATMSEDSPLARVGILPGDLVLSIQDRTVRDAKSFARILNEETQDAEREGATLYLRVQRGDAPPVVHRVPVKRKRALPVAGPGRKPVDRGQPPPANIWSDNPFE